MRLLSIVITSLLLSACSDDSVKTPIYDTKPAVTPDKGTTADKSTTPKEVGTTPTEASTKKDGTAAPADCKTIAECQKPCGVDTTCISTCLNKGCESGKTAMNALTACVMQQCIADCLTGYSQKCDDCSKTKCTTQYNACQSHSC